MTDKPMRHSKKWIVVMYAITGVFVLQAVGLPLAPIVASALFSFLAAYVVGQSFVDGKDR